MDYIRNLSREFDVSGQLELVMENRDGAISVRGEDRPTAHLEVTAYLWAEDEDEADDQLELISRGIRFEGSRLTVRSPALLRPKQFLFFARGPRIEYRLVVPRECRASISSRSGRADVEDISGPLELTGRSGRTSAKQIRGNVRVDKSSGNTQLDAIGGSVTVDSRSGGVRVAGCRGTCSVKSRSGSVQIEEVAQDIDIETRSGSTTVSEAGSAVRIIARSGSVRYDGRVHGPITIDVWSGSIRLTVDPQSVFFMDAESAHGSVRSDLSMRPRSSSPPADAPTVRLRTRSGSIAIVPR